MIPLVDGGTEGFSGHVRVIYPCVSGCFECTLDLFPPQQAGRVRVRVGVRVGFEFGLGFGLGFGFGSGSGLRCCARPPPTPRAQAVPLCTIAETPRNAAHCILYAHLIEYPKVHPDDKPDKDDPVYQNWVYIKVRGRGRG